MSQTTNQVTARFDAAPMEETEHAMTAISPSSLLPLEAYAQVRKPSKLDAMAHRRLRSVRLGEYVTLQFEDEHTVRRQIQELLLIEKAADEDRIRREIAAHAPLVPDGHNWKATVLVEWPEPSQFKRGPPRPVGLAERLWVAVQGQARVCAVACENLGRDDPGPGDPARGISAQTPAVQGSLAHSSLVHSVRFDFHAAQREAIRAGAAVTLGCDHPHYPAQVGITREVLASLAGDLQA